MRAATTRRVRCAWATFALVIAIGLPQASATCNENADPAFHNQNDVLPERYRKTPGWESRFSPIRVVFKKTRGFGLETSSADCPWPTEGEVTCTAAKCDSMKPRVLHQTVRDYVDFAMDESRAIIHRALRVVPEADDTIVYNPFNVAPSDVECTADHTDYDVPNADFVLRVDVEWGTGGCADGGTLAFAAPQSYHASTGRPKTGYTVLCANALLKMQGTDADALETRQLDGARQAEYHHEFVSTMVHETFHAMGFLGSDNCHDWRDSTTGQRYPRVVPALQDNTAACNYPYTTACAPLDDPTDSPTGLLPTDATEKSEWIKSKRIHRATGPRVKAWVDAYYNVTKAGMPFEDGGGAGTARSHWEQRVAFNAGMAGVGTRGTVLVDLTLRFFEDTGWYVGDESMAGDMYWGKGAGAQFFDHKCGDLNIGASGVASNLDPYFCTAAELNSVPVRCATWDRSYYGECKQFAQGLDVIVEGDKVCKVENNDRSCAFDGSPKLETGQAFVSRGSGLKGEYWGETSRCFDVRSDMRRQGQTQRIWDADLTKNVGCYATRCEANRLFVWVASPTIAEPARGEWRGCPLDGTAGRLSLLKPGELPGTDGWVEADYLRCPAAAEICTEGYVQFGVPPTYGTHGRFASSAVASDDPQYPVPKFENYPLKQHVKSAPTKWTTATAPPYHPHPLPAAVACGGIRERFASLKCCANRQTSQCVSYATAYSQLNCDGQCT